MVAFNFFILSTNLMVTPSGVRKVVMVRPSLVVICRIFQPAGTVGSFSFHSFWGRAEDPPPPLRRDFFSILLATRSI